MYNAEGYLRNELNVIPYDKEFGHQICHATGYEVCIDGVWWNEYEDEDGELHYGR